MKTFKSAPRNQILPARIALLLLSLLTLSHSAFAAPGKIADPRRFEGEIRAFEQSDKTNPPPQNAVVFVGSSSIRKWTSLAHDFPDYKVINRGFGGSHLSDSVYYFDRIVLPYHPRLIVLFAGSNDIDFGKTPEQVFEDFKEFAAKIRQSLPEAHLAYISISTTPSRAREVEEVKRANGLIADYIAHEKNMAFIDVFHAMLGPDGKPFPDIFVADKLHLNAKGYEIWTRVIGPFLKQDRVW
jgi:lysophospholipase L1-like esterase